MFIVHMLELHILTVHVPPQKYQKSHFFKEFFLDKHQMVHSLNKYKLCQVLHSTYNMINRSVMLGHQQ